MVAGGMSRFDLLSWKMDALAAESPNAAMLRTAMLLDIVYAVRFVSRASLCVE